MIYAYKCANCGLEYNHISEHAKVSVMKCGSWQHAIINKSVPIGIEPENLWKEKRLIDLRAAIDRYIKAGEHVSYKWLDEYRRLTEELRK